MQSAVTSALGAPTHRKIASMFSKTSGVCLVVLGWGTASIATKLVLARADTVCLTSCLAIGQVAAITGSLDGRPTVVAGHVVPKNPPKK